MITPCCNQKTTTMPKSDLKSLIAETVGTDEKLNSGLSTGFDYPSWSNEIRYILQDGSVVLRKVAFSLGSARSVDTEFTGEDVIRMMLSDAIRWLSMPHTLVFGFVMDKPSFVTVAKLPEQRKRDKTATADEELAELAMNEFFSEGPLELSTKAPGGAWAAVLNCRATRQPFVRYIMRNAALCLPDIILASGKMLLTDFENEEGEAETFRFTRDKVTRIEPSNKIGEFDVAFLHHRRYLSDIIGPAPCLVLTIDTDLLLISCLYAATTGKSDLFMYLAGKRPDTTFWVDSGALVASLHAKAPGETPLESVRGVVNCSLLSGSDFNSGFVGIGHRTMYKTLLSNGGCGSIPSDRSLVRESRSSTRSVKRARGFDWEAHLAGERARAQFTMAYWQSHISGAGDVFVDPFEAHGDAGPGWRRDEALTIVEC